MKIFFSIFVVIIILLLTGCSSFQVINIKECNNETDNYRIYFLPRTVIKIEIETTKKITFKGPYSDYAEKYLGIKDSPDDDNVEYYISDININTLAEPDSNRIFLVKSKNKSILNNINLCNDGLLLSFNGDNDSKRSMYNNEISKNIISIENNKPVFTNLSVKKYFSNHTDTSFKLVKRDSIFVNIPVLNNKIVTKTLADKAEEMANVILNIREERISMISGDNNIFPDGGATKQIIDEYDKLENEYLSLFIGKTIEVKNKYIFYFIPDKDNINKMNTLCFFSKKSGITSNNFSGSYPLMIQVTPQGITNPVTNFNKAYHKNAENGIYYIIPDLAYVNIYDDKFLLISEKILISQLGATSMISEKLLKKKNVKIQFYPALGSLKSIDCK